MGKYKFKKKQNDSQNGTIDGNPFLSDAARILSDKSDAAPTPVMRVKQPFGEFIRTNLNLFGAVITILLVIALTVFAVLLPPYVSDDVLYGDSEISENISFSGFDALNSRYGTDFLYFRTFIEESNSYRLDEKGNIAYAWQKFVCMSESNFLEASLQMVPKGSSYTDPNFESYIRAENSATFTGLEGTVDVFYDIDYETTRFCYSATAYFELRDVDYYMYIVILYEERFPEVMQTLLDRIWIIDSLQ